MAGQAELVELKWVVEEMNRKMDEQTALLQGVIGILSSVMSNPGPGLNANEARIEETPQAYHSPTARVRPRSEVTLSDMFKDLVEFHNAKNHSNKDVGSLSETGTKRQGVHIDESNPKSKRVLCSCESSKAFTKGPIGTTMNPQPSHKTPPRIFSRFPVSLSSVYEMLLETGLIKPLPPTPLPQKLPASHNPSAFCAFHQMPGHPTNNCFRLRHKTQDLIDDGTITVPDLRSGGGF